MVHVVRIGAKGRTVLPAALRAEVRIGVGDELVAHAEDGRIVLETREAIKSRLRSLAAAAKSNGRAVDRLLADRAADLELEERRDQERRRRPAT
jgi:bifunctional DNA-binding transcriptional regulator/antitoxin component of YhaV-PrlF toxin-antitoxin module